MNDDIRQILSAARPSGQDEADPTIMAARQQAAADPVLLAALADEHTLDLQMARALRAVEPPAGLAAAVLTAVRVEPSATLTPEAHATQSSLVSQPTTLKKNSIQTTPSINQSAAAPAAKAEIIPFSKIKANRRQWLSWAAVLIASATGATVWHRQRFTLARLTDRLLDIAHQGVSISLMSMDKNAIASWMTENRAPKATSLPLALDTLPRKGCHLYDIDGRPVSLECFVMPDMQVLHLFSILTAKLADAPSALEKPHITEARDHRIAHWRHGLYTMVLISQQSSEALKSLLS
jgi:hypothetical protein